MDCHALTRLVYKMSKSRLSFVKAACKDELIGFVLTNQHFSAKESLKNLSFECIFIKNSIKIQQILAILSFLKGQK